MAGYPIAMSAHNHVSAKFVRVLAGSFKSWPLSAGTFPVIDDSSKLTPVLGLESARTRPGALFSIKRGLVQFQPRYKRFQFVPARGHMFDTKRDHMFLYEER